MTEGEAAKLIAVLVNAFPGAHERLTPDQRAETRAIYRRMLADLDYPAANAAVERLLATSRFLPTIAEIREAALAVELGETRPGAEAWGLVVKAISRYGAYRVPGQDFEFPDPVIAAAVRSFGWRDLCLSENQTADRARFIEHFDRIAATARRDDLAGALPAAQRLKALREATAPAARLEAARPDQSTPARLTPQNASGEAETMSAVLARLGGHS